MTVVAVKNRFPTKLGHLQKNTLSVSHLVIGVIGRVDLHYLIGVELQHLSHRA